MKKNAHLFPNLSLGQHAPDAIATRHESSQPLDVPHTGTPGFGLKRILVQIDFSEVSLKTLRYAVPVARQFGASLCLVHVIEKTYLATDLGVLSNGCFREPAAKFGMQILINLRHREIGADFPGGVLIRSGEPAQAIAQAAQELGIDLIVMSTVGWSPPGHAVFGPLAERVAHLSRCPVLTVRENLLRNGLAEEAQSTTPWQHIVVPVDFSDRCQCAVRYAAGLTAHLAAHLTLVSVIDPGGANPGERRDRRNDAENELARWAKEKIPETLPFSTEVRMGFPSDNVLEQECERLNADLIVLGIRSRHGLGKSRLFVDPSELILRHAPCPVLSVQPECNSLFRSRLASFRRWGRDLMYRLATNAYIFWGALILVVSLVVGEFTHVNEVLWRATAALGTATVIIGLIHVWLDTHSGGKGRTSHDGRRPKRH